MAFKKQMKVKNIQFRNDTGQLEKLCWNGAKFKIKGREVASYDSLPVSQR